MPRYETPAAWTSLIREITQFAKDREVHMVVKVRENHEIPVGVELTDLYAETTGAGAGTAVMQKFCELLDRHETIAYVWPASRRNTEFYERFGFERTGQSCELVRFPATD